MSHQTTLRNTYHRGLIETDHSLVCLLQPSIGQHLSIPSATVNTTAAMSPFLYHDLTLPDDIQHNQLQVVRPGRTDSYHRLHKSQHSESVNRFF